jgi:hypothetical protein
MKHRKPSDSDRLPRGGMVAAAAIVWTLLVIQFSARHGRLAHEAAYDDCLYMFDAWWRLMAFDRDGLGGLLETVRVAFPHSPGMALHGMLAFALFGVRDVAPYLLNALPLALFLAAVAVLARGAGRLLLALLLVAALSFQVAFVTVHEFRPDPAYAILIAAGVLLAAPDSARCGARRWLPAILLAASLYVKPTFFLNSLFFFGLLWGAQVLLGARREQPSDGRRAALLAALRRQLPQLALFALLTLPLFISHFDYFWTYLVRNAFGEEQSIWKIDGGPLGAVAFFTTGWGGTQMLGKTLDSALLLLAGGGAALLLQRRWSALARTGWLLAFALAGLLVMAAGQLNTPFFGLTFHFLLVLAALAPAAALLACAGRRTRAATAAVLLLAILYNFAHYRSYTDAPLNPDQVPVMSVVDKRHSVVQQLLDALEPQLLPRRFIDEPRVFVALVGSVSSGTLQWAAAKRGLPVRFTAFDRSQPLEDYLREIPQYDYVITAAAGVPELSWYLPTVAHHAAVHDWVAAQPGFIRVAEFPTYGQGGFHLFRASPE